MSVSATASESRNRPPRTWKTEEYNVGEQYWTKLQKWLEEKGYRLRPRFREGWVPSWTGTDKDSRDCEDGQVHRSSVLMDATRISDGAPVMLKAVSRTFHPYELEIGRYLSSEPLASDPKNHCISIHEVLTTPKELRHPSDAESGEDIIVMPLLRVLDNPRFDTIGETVDFFSQIFEGLQYIHSHHIAHRDCTYNIMMDAKPLYPNSWHPVKINRLPDFKTRAKSFTRTERPVKYYFIDFGISRRYKPEDRPPMEPIIVAGDKSPPEHNIDGVEFCDPFPTDVYFLGNLIREEFIQKSLGFSFIEPLVRDMTAENPASRPTIDQVVTRFETIRKSLSSWKVRSRVVSRKEFAVVGLFRILPHWARQIRFIVQSKPAIPSHTK